MSRQFKVWPLWELSEITINLEGKDEAPDGIFFVLGETLRTARSNPRTSNPEHGFACKGYLDFNIQQARDLCEQLQLAIADYDRIDKECEEYHAKLEK